MIEVLSGLVIGLFGSLHCVGMCGPLVLSLPLTKSDRKSIALKSLIYNSGRTITYGLLGLFMGSFGWCLEFGGLQKVFSILLGIVLIYSALTYIFPAIQFNKSIVNLNFLSRIYNLIKKKLVLNTNSNALKIGMLNGLLPCGLVYVALANAVTLSSPKYAAMYMMLFGLGTIPLMFLVMLGGNLYKETATKLRKLIPLALLTLGIYLIYRGINLTLVDNPGDITAGIIKMKCH